MQEYTLSEISEKIGASLIGDASLHINSIATVEDVGPQGICFVKTAKYFDAALASPAAAILISKVDLPAVSDRNFLVADNIRDKLLDMGIVLEDKNDITTWKKKSD